MKPGDIILLNRHGNFYSECQHIFAGPNYTHCEIGAYDDPFGNEIVFSSEEVMMLYPYVRNWQEETTQIEHYELVGFDEDLVNAAVSDAIIEDSHKFYGFLQVTWFIWRWFMEKVFKRDMRKARNPMTKGIICSESTYNFLASISLGKPDLVKELSLYDPNSIHATDFANIIHKFPQYFKLTRIKH